MVGSNESVELTISVETKKSHCGLLDARRSLVPLNFRAVSMDGFHGTSSALQHVVNRRRAGSIVLLLI